MAHRIEIFTKVNDAKSAVMTEKLHALGFNTQSSIVAEVYTINKKFKENELREVAEMLSNPVTQKYLIDNHAHDLDFDFAVEIGFLPGVTDNIGNTARETINDWASANNHPSFQDDESVHSSTLIFLKGNITEEDTQKIGESLANKLIQRISVKSHEKFMADRGMDTIVPKVQLNTRAQSDEVSLNLPEEELLKLGKEGIPESDCKKGARKCGRRGPLALDKESLEVIKKYFEKEKRPPRDIELESLAQTWSEHCKHTIFAAKIDDNEEGIYKGFIKKATQEIRKNKGEKDFCVSVFKDNAGGIIFDEEWVIADKAETHNSPSALDPFGGAITGIVGVNRDCIGFGKGAKPIINKYGFCVGEPDDEEPIYRDKKLENPALSPKRILEGIVEGVNQGGNCSGIPTPQGFVYYHKNYKGKPLVFVGTIGLIPKEINGKPAWEKGAKKGDKIVMLGGRVGMDGIHGATFSSEALTAHSPATAVQIGDPITQKKMSDAIIKEVRKKNLYNSITDNGAGGLSCSVAEMAKECGGCEVQLEKVPTKYPNMAPWQIWISESQERMTLAVPPEKIEELQKIMEKHGVEISVIGEFTDSGRCIVKYNNEKIMDLEMNFLHDGLPRKELKTKYDLPKNPKPDFEQPEDLTETLHKMLSRPNIRSHEFISTQYDHTVQGGAVLGPLQGKGKVNAPASITKPLPESEKGVIFSQGINPTYSFIDTYHMAACAIDTAVRNIIAVGGTLEHMALMDNFCWCSSNEEQRLGELKSAAQACYDYAVAYGAPYISGKDSMFNDFTGYDKDGNEIKISAPPTLLISSLGVLNDVTKAVSIDPKIPGDMVYILGETKPAELGGSEYLAMHGFIGNNVPKVDINNSIKLYKKFTDATEKRLIASALSPSFGGLGAALAKKAIAGQLGMELDLSPLLTGLEEHPRIDNILFSETQARMVVTVAPEKAVEFETLFKDIPHYRLGKITNDKNFIIKDFIKTDIATLDKYYRN